MNESPYATFIVELLLADDGNIRRTRSVPGRGGPERREASATNGTGTIGPRWVRVATVQ
jgi:hypothetical protein